MFWGWHVDQLSKVNRTGKILVEKISMGLFIKFHVWSSEFILSRKRNVDMYSNYKFLQLKRYFPED